MAALQEAERYSCVVLMGQGVAHVRATGMTHTGGYGTACGVDQNLVRRLMHMATVPSTVQSQISNRDN